MLNALSANLPPDANAGLEYAIAGITAATVVRKLLLPVVAQSSAVSLFIESCWVASRLETTTDGDVEKALLHEMTVRRRATVRFIIIMVVNSDRSE